MSSSLIKSARKRLAGWISHRFMASASGNNHTGGSTSYKPYLEALEGRYLLDAYLFQGRLDRNWGTMGNWDDQTNPANQAGIPNMLNDTATIPANKSCYVDSASFSVGTVSAIGNLVVRNGGALTANGITVLGPSPLDVQAGGTVLASSIMANNQAIVSVEDSGSLKATTSMDILGGSSLMIVGGTVTSQGASGVHIDARSTLDGFGLIRGNVTNEGAYSVILNNNPLGTLTVTGSFNNSGNIEAYRDGTAMDFISVGGVLTAGGSFRNRAKISYRIDLDFAAAAVA